jgi:hypothetical protein
MPVAYQDPPETELPGANRRRVWARPELASHALAVLTFERLHLAPPGGPAPDAAAVEAGGDLAEQLGPGAVAIDLADVRRLRLDLLANAITIDHAAGGRAGRLTVAFASPEAADACFTKVWHRLGGGFQLQPYRRDPWSAARSPLALLFGALLAAAVLATTLSVYEDTASVRAAARREAPDPAAVPPDSPLEEVLNRLDWRWACAAGGAGAALAQVWLYRRVTRPPVALELTRLEKAPAAGRPATAKV